MVALSLIILGCLWPSSDHEQNVYSQETWSKASQELELLSKALPAILAVCRCEVKCENMKQKSQASDEVRLAVESDFLSAFEAVMKEITSFAGVDGLSEQGQRLRASLQKAKEIMLARVASQMEGSVKEVVDLTARIQGDLIDLKPILKALDERMDELVNFPNRAEMIANLKALNGMQGGGLKRFDKLASALAGTALKEVGGVEVAKCRADALSARNQARLLVSCRSAAVIITKSKASDVPQFYNELKALKVNLPKELKSRLDALTA